jgi:hypothetical protein
MLAMKALADPLAEAPHSGDIQPRGLCEETLVGAHSPMHGVALSLTEPNSAIAWKALV